MNKVRVRYAPSPTGNLHIGNARTALFNYLFAKRNKGEFILRIEDTDSKRNTVDGESSQLKYLEWLGIDYDEGIYKEKDYGPYRQSERIGIYQKYAEQLISEGKAYRCYMTAEELEEEREEQISNGMAPRYGGKHANLSPEEEEAFIAEGRKPAIRIRVPQDRSYSWTDMVKGDLSFEGKDFGDFVIIKNDGVATYNFCVVVDDYLMKISHVLRGDDHISNTPKQLVVYEALNFTPPIFGHMTLIVNENKKKLSKRDESIIQFIEQYDLLGYLPEAIFNFIALLGWSPEGEREIFSRDEFAKIFDEKRLSKSPAFFDNQKLTWINNQYIKKQPLERIVDLSLPFLVKEGLVTEEEIASNKEWFDKLIALYQPQMSYGAEIVELTKLFFNKELKFSDEEKEVLALETNAQVYDALIKKIGESENFTADNIKNLIKEIQKETGVKGKSLFMPIRVATTGQMHGPELNLSLELLGKELVIERLKSQL
ncbi:MULTISPECIES: glutamate--tRNA ligase [unclassified Gemella]|uniref:glutamate--tRNA ligase n=1 Tax=unclassified Gemella TaxID=2624949 RepID=UPI00107460FD|nr:MULTISPECIES: glutamate--tRNA ligase [unclassified Gemella]MBF0710703.1 glutamate--tRNA ligase [Gemella sp. GL1.1]MBF0746728.1 glutamate--tRNA ligase [Gemella sp. 19428wG2_WT2a]NYS28047.1 glutamate--tRNA ligase [Gemella sp. GL1]TFU60076.1 glutamate--tRNA ligase [Gemella sp. WT2a]